MGKYEELCRLAKDLVEQTEDRFDTIDAKAANARVNEEVDICYALARRYQQAWAENDAVNNTKLRDLARGYKLIMLTVALLAAFAMLYAAYVWVT